MPAASYTRGVNMNVTHQFDPLCRNITNSDTSPHIQQGSLSLGQYRRQCVSMSAMPLRVTNFNQSETNRPSSWSMDSPKKIYGSRSPDPQRQFPGIVFSRLFSYLDFGRLDHRAFRNNKKECRKYPIYYFFLVSWFTLLCLIIVGYKFFSDGSFSAILTLGSAFQCFSLALLNLKVASQQSVSGVSQRSVFLVVICLLFRLLSTIFYNGYLPVDKSGDWLYQVADAASASLGTILLLYASKYCNTSVQSQKDKDTCYVVIPALIAAGLAILIHPHLNQNFLADSAWTFALYLETFAMVPQLFMMGKLGGEVEALTSHYVASMAASKLFTFLFWYFSFAELTPKGSQYNLAGWAVITSYSIQTLIFADFI